MVSVIWAQELQAAIKKSQSVVDKLVIEKDTEAVETRDRLQRIGHQMRSALSNSWMNEDDGFYEIAYVTINLHG
jgi:cohesin loading factor subunit SCC2